MTKQYNFIFIPAEDDTVDSEYEMKTIDGEDTNFAIQKCEYGGGYSIIEYHYENGKLTEMSDHGTFKTFKTAKLKAVALHEGA